METEPLALVVCDGGIGSPPMVLAAYIGALSAAQAQAHANTIKGASVLVMQAHRTLRPEARDDITAEFEMDDDTPVVECEWDVETPPMTPTARADRSTARQT